MAIYAIAGEEKQVPPAASLIKSRIEAFCNSHANNKGIPAAVVRLHQRTLGNILLTFGKTNFFFVLQHPPLKSFTDLHTLGRIETSEIIAITSGDFDWSSLHAKLTRDQN